MGANVSATCPSCGNHLRFPVEWAGREMKCKKCGSVIKARNKRTPPDTDMLPRPSSPTVPALKPIPAVSVVQPIVAPAAAETVPTIATIATAEPVIVPQGFEDIPVSPFVSRSGQKYRRGSGGLGKILAALGVLIFGSVAAIAGYLVWKKQNEESVVLSPATNRETPPTSRSLLNASSIPSRRLLFVSITKYAYLNPLSAGQGARGDAAGDIARKMAFEWRVPTEGPSNQFYLLSDTTGSDKPSPIVKTIFQPTLDRFLQSSRTQDRIVIYFGGHAIEKEGKAYLCPADGDPDDLATLVPLDTFYDNLKACPAQQKIVIWDVCRFNPQFGRVLPGSEPMSEGLAKALMNPPPGVQSLVTCSAGENALELPRTGSEFLDAFRVVAEKAAGPKAGTGPDEAIPVAEWTTAVQVKLGQFVSINGKALQTVKLTGTTGETVAFNAEEPAAGRVEIPAAPPGADPAAVAAAFALIDLPGLRSDKASQVGRTNAAFAVAGESMKDYLVDAVTADEAIKQKENFPIRAAAAAALIKMRAVWKGTGAENGGLRETFIGEATDRVKRAIENEQNPVARIDLELREIIESLKALEGQLDKEPSKRWRATFQYAYAQALARSAFLNEYNLMLGVIRKNELPPLDEKKGQNGWQMISVDQMKSKKEEKEKAELAQELFGKIATEHKGTPWAVLAKQYKNVKLGLEWRVVTPGENKGD
jgi:hypothetical protein